MDRGEGYRSRWIEEGAIGRVLMWIDWGGEILRWLYDREEIYRGESMGWEGYRGGLGVGRHKEA